MNFPLAQPPDIPLALYFLPLFFLYIPLLIYFLYYLWRLKTKGPWQPMRDGRTAPLWMHRGAIVLTLFAVPYFASLGLGLHPLIRWSLACLLFVALMAYVGFNSRAVARWRNAQARQRRDNRHNGHPGGPR